MAFGLGSLSTGSLCARLRALVVSQKHSSANTFVFLQTELLDAAELEVGGYQERCAQLLLKLQALEQAAKDSARNVTELLVRPFYRYTESRSLR